MDIPQLLNIAMCFKWSGLKLLKAEYRFLKREREKEREFPLNVTSGS